jgi:CAAX prenyl protease-like protein
MSSTPTSTPADSPRATRALTWPFFLWIAGLVVLFLPHSFDLPAYVYAAKTILCAGLTLFLKPWRYAPCHAVKGATPLGILIGIAVYVLWALPESTPWPEVTNAYRRWLVMMPGTLPDYSASWCYAYSEHPILAIIKLFGSAFVIAPIEEFFFRGCLMRWLNGQGWQKLPFAEVSRYAFWVTAIVFAFEHDRYVGGLLAGVAYGALAIRTGSLRASIIAHVVTNFLLGLHVLLFDAYGFW